MSQPLSTLQDAIDYLDYHAPTPDQQHAYALVNAAYQNLMTELWDLIPEGPGRTVVIRAIGNARMQTNSAIANGGI